MAIIPALLAALGCGLAGMFAASLLRKRQLLLEAWQRALMRIITALKNQRIALDGLLEMGLGEHPLLDARLLGTIAAMRKNPALPPDEAWREAVMKHPCNHEMDEERALSHKLFYDLSTGSLEQRRDLIAQHQLSFDTLTQKATQTYAKNGRLYQSLGWLGGLALLLMLL